NGGVRHPRPPSLSICDFGSPDRRSVGDRLTVTLYDRVDGGQIAASARRRPPGTCSWPWPVTSLLSGLRGPVDRSAGPQPGAARPETWTNPGAAAAVAAASDGRMAARTAVAWSEVVALAPSRSSQAPASAARSGRPARTAAGARCSRAVSADSASPGAGQKGPPSKAARKASRPAVNAGDSVRSRVLLREFSARAAT